MVFTSPSRRLGLVFVLLALSSCATYSPSIKATDKVEATDAFFYGRFHIEHARFAFGAINRDQTVGFNFKCTDGSSYTVRFSPHTPTQVVRVKPSVCSFAEVVFTENDHVVHERKAPPANVFQNVQVTAGKAYYLGDFEAYFGSSRSSGNTVGMLWSVRRAYDNYEGTTTTLRTRFPNLEQVATENHVLFTL